VNRRAWRLAFDVLAAVFVFAIGGALQVGVLVVVLVVLRKRWLSPTVVTLVAASLVVVGALSILPPIGPALAPIDPTWPLRRQDAQYFVLQAVVLFVGGLVGFAREALQGAPIRPTSASTDLEPDTRARPNGGSARGAPVASASGSASPGMSPERPR
jgi:hypothetical protein